MANIANLGPNSGRMENDFESDFCTRDEPKIVFPSRIQEHFLQTLWVSMSDENPSVIVAYNTQQLTMLGALFTFNGTILDTLFTWLQALFMQFLAWGFVGFFYALEVESSSLDTSNVASAVSIINAVLAFSLGLYVSVSISRWWEMRGAVGAVIGATSNLVMALCMFAPENTPRMLSLKRRVVRYGTASLALLFIEEERMAKLMRRGLLTSVEVKALEGKGSQAMILWLWIGSLLQRAFAERLLLADIKVLMKLYSNVQEARNSIQKVGTFINVQLPLPYVHVIICITKLVFLMLTFQGGCSIYVALYENDFLGLLMEMMILVIVPLIYQGLIDLTEKIGNPFGGDEIDFPGELYQKQLLAQCNEFIEAAQNPPDWIPMVPDIAALRHVPGKAREKQSNFTNESDDEDTPHFDESIKESMSKSVSTFKLPVDGIVLPPISALDLEKEPSLSVSSDTLRKDSRRGYSKPVKLSQGAP